MPQHWNVPQSLVCHHCLYKGHWSGYTSLPPHLGRRSCRRHPNLRHLAFEIQHVRSNALWPLPPTLTRQRPLNKLHRGVRCCIALHEHTTVECTPVSGGSYLPCLHYTPWSTGCNIIGLFADKKTIPRASRFLMPLWARRLLIIKSTFYTLVGNPLSRSRTYLPNATLKQDLSSRKAVKK